MNRPVHRTGVRFSADGRHAACVAVDGDGTTAVELWTLTAAGPRRVLRFPVPDGPVLVRPVPLPGHRLLAAVSRDGHRELVVWDATGMVASRPAPALWPCTPLPDGPGLALAMTLDPDAPGEIVRVDGDLRVARAWPAPLPVPRPAEWCGAVLPDGRVVTAARSPAGPWSPMILDPASGDATPLPLPPTLRVAVPVCAGGGRVVLAATRSEGRTGLAVWSPPGNVEPVPEPVAVTGRVRPLVLAPDGAELLVRSRWGAVSRLWRVDVATGEARRIVAPDGLPGTEAGWTRHGLWLPFTPTTAPNGLWWAPAAERRLRPAGGPAPVTAVPGRAEELPGAAGEVEAVVYGDWRRATRVVLALHGGPAEHWQLRFDPLLQAFAQAGLAVVALNPRGSSGYDRQFEEAIRGAWGGPDLADVLAAGDHLARVRGDDALLPALYGVSYGAFLALLAVAEAPAAWSGCAAVAPFTSPSRLYAQAIVPVRALLDRLEATSPAGGGPRDLLREAPRMRGRILLVHGDRDPVVPVAHSRELASALAANPAVELCYREVPGGAHPPLSLRPDDSDFQRLVRFLEPCPAAADAAVAIGPAGAHVASERR